MTAYDPKYAKFSPGNLLIEECVRIAIDEKVDFDFRIIRDEYKARWADREISYGCVAVATSLSGLPWVALDKLKLSVLRLRSRYGGPLKAKLRALMKRSVAVFQNEHSTA